MVTNIFARSNVSFLATFARPRFRYETADHRLILFNESTSFLPPSWFDGLRIEVVGDNGSARVPIEFVWTEVDASLLVARATCPEVFRSCSDSDMVPIARLFLIVGEDEVSLENMRSPKAFAAREMSPAPVI